MNSHHSKLNSKRSQSAKLNHLQAQELEKKEAAKREGYEAGRDPSECALIPAKYHNKDEEGDAWFAGFMESRAAVGKKT